MYEANKENNNINRNVDEMSYGEANEFVENVDQKGESFLFILTVEMTSQQLQLWRQVVVFRVNDERKKSWWKLRFSLLMLDLNWA